MYVLFDLYCGSSGRALTVVLLLTGRPVFLDVLDHGILNSKYQPYVCLM